MQLKNNTFPPLLHEVHRIPVPGILKDIVNKKPAQNLSKVIPDRKWGETILAVVVPVEGIKPSSKLEQEIIEHCRGKIAGYKRPRLIKFIQTNEMPRTATGKILRRGIRDWYKEE